SRGPLFHDGRQPGPEQRQPLLGFRGRRPHQRTRIPRVDELQRPEAHRQRHRIRGATAMQKQRGVTLTGLIITLAVLGFLGVMAAKLVPAYIDYFAVKKMFSSMEQAGDFKLSVREIRKSFETRNTIESVNDVKGDDLEIGKEGGETVVSVAWSKKVSMVGNVSFCLDFYVTSAK